MLCSPLKFTVADFLSGFPQLVKYEQANLWETNVLLMLYSLSLLICNCLKLLLETTVQRIDFFVIICVLETV